MDTLSVAGNASVHVKQRLSRERVRAESVLALREQRAPSEEARPGRQHADRSSHAPQVFGLPIRSKTGDLADRASVYESGCLWVRPGRVEGLPGREEGNVRDDSNIRTPGHPSRRRRSRHTAGCRRSAGGCKRESKLCINSIRILCFVKALHQTRLHHLQPPAPRRAKPI
jgi:hypothetical protein